MTYAGYAAPGDCVTLVASRSETSWQREIVESYESSPQQKSQGWKGCPQKHCTSTTGPIEWGKKAHEHPRPSWPVATLAKWQHPLVLWITKANEAIHQEAKPHTKSAM